MTAFNLIIILTVIGVTLLLVAAFLGMRFHPSGTNYDKQIRSLRQSNVLAVMGIIALLAAVPIPFIAS